MKVTFILTSQSYRPNARRKGQDRKRILNMYFPSYLWPHWSSKPWRESKLLSKVFSPWQQGWWLAQPSTGRALLDGALWWLTPITDASPTRMALRINNKRAGQASQLMNVGLSSWDWAFHLLCCHSFRLLSASLQGQQSTTGCSHPVSVCKSIANNQGTFSSWVRKV